MKITFQKYDEIEELCEKIKNNPEIIINNETQQFNYYEKWPRLSELQEADIEKHFEDYFLYLMFWYTQDLSDDLAEDKKELAEYKKTREYIDKVFKRKLEFV